MLPKRFTKESVPDGAAKELSCKIDEMLPEFYTARELDPITGKPSQKVLDQAVLDI
jgi:aldehyde:ferredoxin oxidoreductase